MASRARPPRTGWLAVGAAAALWLTSSAPSLSSAAHARPASPPRTCADPTDCRLHEAGAPAGVRIGMAVRPEDPDEARIGAAEGASVINHGISWNVVEPQRGVYRWGGPDHVAAYARANGLEQVAMHLFWDQQGLDDLPDWVLEITDPEELREVLRARVRAVFERYRDFARVDVLNEPIETGGGQPANNHFRRVLGPDYAVELFVMAAAEAPPDTELFLNENLIEYLPQKADALVAFVRHLVQAGAPIDAVGLQSHFLAGEPNWDLYRATMERLAALGVKVFISELDVPVAPEVTDRATVQAERYRRGVATCLAVPACDEVIVWGISDRSSWLDQFLGPGLAPLLFDENLQPKPAYYAVRDQLLEGRPGSSGPNETTTVPAAEPDPSPSTSAPTPVATAAAPAQPIGAEASYVG